MGLKVDEIRGMTPGEIDEKVLAFKKELFELRVQAKTGKLEKQDRIKELRRNVARLKTVKREAERAAR